MSDLSVYASSFISLYSRNVRYLLSPLHDVRRQRTSRQSADSVIVLQVFFIKAPFRESHLLLLLCPVSWGIHYVPSLCFFFLFFLIRNLRFYSDGIRLHDPEYIFQLADPLFIIQFTFDSGMINFSRIRSGNHEGKMRIRCSCGIRVFGVISLFIDNSQTLG